MTDRGLKELWLKTTRQYTGSAAEWAKIEAAYSKPGRHYHTLQHLCELYEPLATLYGENIPAASLFALFFHDYIYNTLRSDNEKQSAAYASAVLSSWHVEEYISEQTNAMILATADHQGSDPETMAFLDADMAILGSEAQKYKDYTGKVRKEFSIYPDILYRRGRKKFIEATLRSDGIFLTPAFREKYEMKARANMLEELKSLS